MPPPGLHIYLRPRMTLTVDLLTPKSRSFFMPLPRGPLATLADWGDDGSASCTVGPIVR